MQYSWRKITIPRSKAMNCKSSNNQTKLESAEFNEKQIRREKKSKMKTKNPVKMEKNRKNGNREGERRKKLKDGVGQTGPNHRKLHSNMRKRLGKITPRIRKRKKGREKRKIEKNYL